MEEVHKQKSEEELEATLQLAVRRLQERGAVAACPRCGKNNWHAGLFGFFVSALPVTGMSLPPPHIPVLNLTCNNCGSTQLHNLNALGIKL